MGGGSKGGEGARVGSHAGGRRGLTGVDARADGAARQHFRQGSDERLRQSRLASYGASGKSRSDDKIWSASESLDPTAQRAFDRNAPSVDPSGGNDRRRISSASLKAPGRPPASQFK